LPHVEHSPSAFFKINDRCAPEDEPTDCDLAFACILNYNQGAEGDTIFMRKHYLSILLAPALTCTAPVFAYTDSPVPAAHSGSAALLIPWNSFADNLGLLLKDYQAHDQESLADQVVSVDSLDWHITGVTTTVDARFKPQQFTPQFYTIGSTGLNISIGIAQIAVDQVITRTVGGVTVHVHVQAQCGPVQLSQSHAQGTAKIGYEFSMQAIRTTVSELALHWPDASWAINDFACQGPAGLDQQLKNNLAERLKNPAPFLPAIQTTLTAKIQTEVNALVDKLKKPVVVAPQRSQLPLHLVFDHFISQKAGLVVYGQLSWFSTLGSAALLTPRPLGLDEPVETRIETLPDAVLKSSTPVLITRRALWTQLIEAELAANHAVTVLDLSSQDFFKKLMSSRLKQWLVWPDLLNFAPTTPFHFLLEPPQVTSLTWLEDGSAQALINSGGWIQADRGGSNWNYIRLSGDASAHITPQITQGKLELNTVSSKSHVSPSFGYDYIQAFHPNVFLGPALLTSLKQSLETTLNYETALPAISLGNFGVAQFNGWSAVAPDSIAIPIALPALTP
jgi:hypothetical protein